MESERDAWIAWLKEVDQKAQELEEWMLEHYGWAASLQAREISAYAQGAGFAMEDEEEVEQ